MTEEVDFFDLNPETHTEGGGLFDDADAVISAAKYEMFTYPGGNITTCSLKLTLTDNDGEESGQQYSVGDPRFVAPSKDGTQLVKLGDKKGISKSSNCSMLMRSLTEAGFPSDAWRGSDCTVLVGLKAHWLRRAVPKKKESDKERSVLLVTEILELPGEKKAGKKASAKKAGAGTGANDGDDAAQEAQALILEVLGTDGSVTKAELLKKVTVLAQTRKLNMRKIIPILKDDFLGSDEALWNYDGTNVSPLA